MSLKLTDHCAYLKAVYKVRHGHTGKNKNSPPPPKLMPPPSYLFAPLQAKQFPKLPPPIWPATDLVFTF